MKFTSLKNKLRKIWFSASDNKIRLSQKSSSLFHWLSLPKFQKNYIVLFESDWNSYATIPYITQSTTFHKDPMPSYIKYDFNQNIEVPDSFLPFIKTDILFKKVEKTEADMLTEFTPSGWKGNYYKSYGNAYTLIYKGFNDRYFNELYGQTELDEKNFLKKHTKKFWEAEIFYTEAGSDFKAVGTIRWIKHRYLITGTQYGLYTCSPWEDSSFFDRNTYFKSVRGTEITGNMEDNDLGGFSIQTVNILDGDTSTHVHGKIFKDIGGTWIQVGINHTIDGNDISSATISFNDSTDHSFNDYSGYLLFYSWKTQWIFRIIDNEPSNIPDITVLPSTTLPYNYFTWKFNPEGYPFRVDGEKQFLSGTQNKVTFKNKTDNYNIKLNGKIYLKQPAVTVATSTIFEHFNDIYSISGNTYDITIERHTESTKKTYVAESIDVELKFKIIFYNPLQFTQGIKIDGKI